MESDVLLDYVQGRLDKAHAARMEEHLAGCEGCRSRVDEFRVMSSLMSPTEVEPSPAVDMAVLRAIRESTVTPAGPVARTVTRRRFRLRRSGDGLPAFPVLALFTAAAAALLVVIGIYSATRPAPSGPSSAERTPGEPVVTPRPPVVNPPVKESPPPVSEPRKEEPRKEVTPTLVEPKPLIPPPPRVARTEPQLPEEPQPAVTPNPVVVQPSEPPARTVVEAPVPFGRVAQLTGRTEVDRPVAQGSLIFAGKAVTVRSGTVMLELPDGSLVVARSGTAFTPHTEDGAVRLELTRGELACSVTPREVQHFTVRTPHGKVAVKGTVYSVGAGKFSTTVAVARGRVEVRNDHGSRDVSAGQRLTVRANSAPGETSRADVTKRFSWAFAAGLKSMDTLWITAGDAAARLQKPMAPDRRFARGSLSGAPLCARVDVRALPGWTGRTLPADRDAGGWVEYPADLPASGRWYLWARLYFPATGTQLWKQTGNVKENDPNSFFVRVDGGPEQILGNLKRESVDGPTWYRRWHWGGDGAVEVGHPRPIFLGELEKGRHLLRIRTRDAVETATLPLAPRLDVLCLTTDPDYVPRDADFGR